MTREDVEIIAWPSRNTPEGFASQPGEVIGRGVIGKVHRNEPLLMAKLASKEAGGGLPITIPPGFRAVSVEVDEVIGVAGFVLPGTLVDVLATVMPGTNRSETTTRMILQKIPVLTADQSYQTDPAGDPVLVTVVTLLVKPEEAEALTLASTEGRDSAGTSEHAGRGFSEHARNADQLPGPRPPETCPPGPLHNAGQTSRGCGGGDLQGRNPDPRQVQQEG